MGRLGLLWFDLTRGRWTALRALRAHLGWRRLLRAVLAFAWRDLFTDPFRALPRRRVSPRERLTRRQMRPVLLLDDVLRGPLGIAPAEAQVVLRDLVGRTGARFIAWNLPPLERPAWERLDDAGRRRFVDRVLGCFFNMEVRPVDDAEADLAFDVHGCWFAALAHELGRPGLGALFCAADAVHFDDPAVSIGLRRTETLAAGGGRCDFRFTWKG